MTRRCRHPQGGRPSAKVPRTQRRFGFVRPASLLRFLLLCAYVVFGLHGCAAPRGATQDLPRQSGTVTVRAFVDGKDVLTIDGPALAWAHLDDETAAVGRWNGNRPTVVNGTKWYPNWGRTRDYRRAISSDAETVPYGPTIPRYRDTVVTVQRIDGGRAPSPSVQLLPRDSARAPVQMLFDNTGAADDRKWIEVTLHWTTTTDAADDMRLSRLP